MPKASVRGGGNPKRGENLWGAWDSAGSRQDSAGSGLGGRGGRLEFRAGQKKPALESAGLLA